MTIHNENFTIPHDNFENDSNYDLDFIEIVKLKSKKRQNQD